MKVEVGFSEVMGSQKVVEHANYVVCSLASVDCFINEVVHLYSITTNKAKCSRYCFLIKVQLPRYRHTAHPENCILAGCEVVHLYRLLWVAGIVRLKHVLMVMYSIYASE